MKNFGGDNCPVCSPWLRAYCEATASDLVTVDRDNP